MRKFTVFVELTSHSAIERSRYWKQIYRRICRDNRIAKKPNIKKKPWGVSYETLETRLLIQFLCTKCTKYQWYNNCVLDCIFLGNIKKNHEQLFSVLFVWVVLLISIRKHYIFASFFIKTKINYVKQVKNKLFEETWYLRVYFLKKCKYHLIYYLILSFS